MGRVEEKVACQYCGKEYSKAGVANHEKACAKNPDNKEAEETVETAEETVEETVEVKEELFKVKMKDSIECYIGDRYYRLKAGQSYEVTSNVKGILKRAGLLDAI